MGPVMVIGSGKVGRALSRAWKAAGVKVILRSARRAWPSRPIRADVLVIATRDQVIAPLVESLLERRVLGHRSAVVLHCAGAMTPEVLEPLRQKKVAVGRLHPLVAIASTRRAPELDGLTAHISGDPHACRVAKRLARLAGLVPTEVSLDDTALYHAAAVMVAGGGIALLDAGRRLLQEAGIEPAVATPMLASLLSSVIDNVTHLGIPEGLTGPVRRGSPETIAAHGEKLAAAQESLMPLYRALVGAQIELARELNEASPESFDAIVDLVERM